MSEGVVQRTTDWAAETSVIHFLTVWRLEVQDQGAGGLFFLRPLLSLACRWLLLPLCMVFPLCKGIRAVTPTPHSACPDFLLL